MGPQRTDILQPTLDRLAKLIERQYGCEMIYLFQNDLQKEVQPKLRQEMLKGLPLTHEEKVYFPVLVNQTLAGAALVKKANDLTTSRKNYLHQVIKMVLETKLVDLDRLQLVEHFESQLQVAEAEAKITPITHMSGGGENAIVGAPSSEFEENFDFPCLIESKESFDIFKMGLEIHQAAARFAYLPIQDLEAGVIESSEKLASLGRVSLFVDDIKRLTFGQQSALSLFLQTRERMESPQLIVGTTRAYGELKNDPEIHPGFLSQISIGYLQLSQPFSTYKKENLIQFFFEGLTGRARLTLDSTLAKLTEVAERLGREHDEMLLNIDPSEGFGLRLVENDDEDESENESDDDKILH